MSKDYGIVFGSDPRVNTGLTPTFILFYNLATGATLIPPGITEIIAGSGCYRFSYGPTIATYFECDGGSSLASSDRYATGILDPIQIIDQRIGTSNDSFGTDVVDPDTLFGFAKRGQEDAEGNAEFIKATGVWTVSSRGSSQVLFIKTLTNDASEANKS